MTVDTAHGTGPTLRRDAARNRALILEVAAEVFAERGLEAGYDEIARRAGVGVGTVYRRFPERAELVRAIFETRIDEIVEVAEHAATMPDAFEGLVHFLERTLERQVADRGLKEVLALTITQDEHRVVGQERLGPVIEALVERARAEGTLRPDVQANDLGPLLMLLGSVSTPAEPELWRRYLAVLLDGLRARPDAGALPLAAPADDDLHELIGHLQR